MIRNEATPNVVELELYGDVGWSPWGDGVTAKDVSAALRGVSKSDTIKLRINSPGGDVFEGFAIYNLLAQHPARVEVSVDGLAASAASFIAMAGDQISAAENAMLMIHRAWGIAMGNTQDMAATADLLDQLDQAIAGVYAARTGMKKADLLAMMSAETWMGADEAKKLGFVDTVTPNKAKPKARAAVRQGYRNAPREQLEELGFDVQPWPQPIVEEAFRAARPPVTHDQRSAELPEADGVLDSDAFSPDGTMRSAARAAAQVRTKLLAGQPLTDAERELAVAWANGAEQEARTENSRRAPVACLEANPQRRLGDCL